MDGTKALLDEQYPFVTYVWNPYPNKTLAQYAGCILAEKYDHVVIMDDDVTLPPKLNFCTHLISGKVRAVCYPIRAVHPGDIDTTFVRCQAIEYKMADYMKAVQSRHSTVLYPHGAISLWDRATLMEVLRWHDTVFYGKKNHRMCTIQYITNEHIRMTFSLSNSADDVKMGMWLQQQGYHMKLAHSVLGTMYRFDVMFASSVSVLSNFSYLTSSYIPVDTEAPTSAFGKMPNYYSQRVKSWDMAEHTHVGPAIKLFLTTKYPTFFGTLLMKAFQVWHIYTIFADWLRVWYIVFVCIANA